MAHGLLGRRHVPQVTLEQHDRRPRHNVGRHPLRGQGRRRPEVGAHGALGVVGDEHDAPAPCPARPLRGPRCRSAREHPGGPQVLHVGPADLVVGHRPDVAGPTAQLGEADRRVGHRATRHGRGVRMISCTAVAWTRSIRVIDPWSGPRAHHHVVGRHSGRRAAGTRWPQVQIGPSVSSFTPAGSGDSSACTVREPTRGAAGSLPSMPSFPVETADAASDAFRLPRTVDPHLPDRGRAGRGLGQFSGTVSIDVLVAREVTDRRQCGLARHQRRGGPHRRVARRSGAR